MGLGSFQRFQIDTAKEKKCCPVQWDVGAAVEDERLCRIDKKVTVGELWKAEPHRIMFFVIVVHNMLPSP